jgi:hypothetical protein
MEDCPPIERLQRAQATLDALSGRLESVRTLEKRLLTLYAAQEELNRSRREEDARRLLEQAHQMEAQLAGRYGQRAKKEPDASLSASSGKSVSAGLQESLRSLAHQVGALKKAMQN